MKAYLFCVPFVPTYFFNVLPGARVFLFSCHRVLAYLFRVLPSSCIFVLCGDGRLHICLAPLASVPLCVCAFVRKGGGTKCAFFSHHGNGKKILMNRGSCDKAHRARKTNMAVLAFVIGILIFWGLADCCVEQVKVPAYIVM